MKYSTVAVLALAVGASSVAANPRGRASRVGSHFGKALNFMGTFAQNAQMGGMMYRSLDERDLADIDSQLYTRDYHGDRLVAAREFDDELVTRGRHGKHGKGKGRKGRGRKGRKHGHRKGGKGGSPDASAAGPAAAEGDPAAAASAEAAPAEAEPAARSFDDEFEARSFDEDDLLALRDLIEALEVRRPHYGSRRLPPSEAPEGRSFDEAFLNELD